MISAWKNMLLCLLKWTNRTLAYWNDFNFQHEETCHFGIRKKKYLKTTIKRPGNSMTICSSDSSHDTNIITCPSATKGALKDCSMRWSF